MSGGSFNITEERAQALVRLRSNPDFMAFLEMLGERAEIMNRQLVMNDDDATDITIGQLRTLILIMDAHENAESTYAKFQQPKT